MVRTSLLAAIVGVHAFQGTRYTVAGEVPYGQGNHHPSICPYGLFHCADGLLQIAVGSEGLWRKLAAEFDLPVDARASPPTPSGSATGTTWSAAVDAAFAPHPLAELLPRLAEIGIPAGEVRTLDRVYDWDQTRRRDCSSRSSTPSPGASPCPAPRCASTATRSTQHRAPPLLGQHDESVRAWLAEVEPTS